MISTKGWSVCIMTSGILASLVTGSFVSLNTTSAIFQVDPEFISVTLDFQMVDLDPRSSIPRWFGFGFNKTRTQTLLRGLSPCYLRFGGTGADMAVFSDPSDVILYDQPTAVKMYNVFPEDIDNLILLTRASGARLLYDLNLSLRYLSDWNPNNALRLIKYIISKGYADNVDFELGNEPNQYRPHLIPPWPWPPQQEHSMDANTGGRYETKRDLGQVLLTGKQIGLDFVSLIHLIKQFPALGKSKVVGPDLAGGFSGYMPDFLNVSGANLSATTFHHYYFNGRSADPYEYIKPAHFDTLKRFIQTIKDLVKDHSPNKQLPIWNGETADAFDSGTPNVSNRFISGFLWLDKLGISAQMGVSVVTRQTFSGGYYGLINGRGDPNPDYWVSYIHRMLVGRKVLNVTISGANNNLAVVNSNKESLQLKDGNGTLLVRLYAHCAKPSKRYLPGTVTLFGINLKNTSELLEFVPPLDQQPIDQYILTPYGTDGLLSREIALNGKPLRMVNDDTFPDLVPVSRSFSSKGVKFPPLGFGFWVFPNLRISACS